MSLADVGFVGLGVMGGALARNVASRGFSVAGFDRDVEAARRLAAEHPEARLAIAGDLAGFVASLARPRRIVLLVNAGKPVDAVLDGLDPLLDEGDVVVDAGNSLYTDTNRRLARAEGRPWRFVGMGVSGGEEGALTGPSMMPGGAEDAWAVLRPVLEAAAARTESGPCVTDCGRGSAGHFVKMVHNGIEYGDMQLIAETSLLLREGLGFSPARVADTFAAWNAGPLESFLVELTAGLFRVEDPERPGAPLVDAVLDTAGQKGTGRWTVMVAAELGVAIPTISSAVDARVLSAAKKLRIDAERTLALPRAPLAGISSDDLATALWGAKVASYSQGFELIRAGSAAFGYGTNLSEIARIWTGGCIIRARLLGRIREAFSSADGATTLALAPSFAPEVARAVPSWRRVVAAATSAGFPIPALAASLSWLETLARGRGTANVIQAQRDAFGAHGYERTDRPGPVHSDWTPL